MGAFKPVRVHPWDSPRGAGHHHFPRAAVTVRSEDGYANLPALRHCAKAIASSELNTQYAPLLSLPFTV